MGRHEAGCIAPHIVYTADEPRRKTAFSKEDKGIKRIALQKEDSDK